MRGSFQAPEVLWKTAFRLSSCEDILGFPFPKPRSYGLGVRVEGSRVYGSGFEARGPKFTQNPLKSLTEPLNSLETVENPCRALEFTLQPLQPLQSPSKSLTEPSKRPV